MPIHMGIEIDDEKNTSYKKGTGEISTADSRVRVLVVPTNEELRIAQETKKIIDCLTC